MLNYRLISFHVCLFSLLLCWSCTRTINAKIDSINLPTPQLEPLPIMVGVYYGDYLLTYKTSQTYQDPGGQTFVYNVEFGKANIALFDYITSGLFREVKHFSRLPFGSWTMGNIDLIIEPTVDHYSPWFPVDLEYKVKFYLPSGKIIIWPIKGTSQEQLTSFMDQIISTNNLIKHTQFAMRDFAAKFMVGFCKHYELKNFFSDQCGQ